MELQDYVYAHQDVGGLRMGEGKMGRISPSGSSALGCSSKSLFKFGASAISV